MMQSLKREQLLEWQDGQGCKGGVKVLLHFWESKNLVFFERNAVLSCRRCKSTFTEKKISSIRASATEARTSQRVERQWVKKQIDDRMLHSRCNAASKCLAIGAFFPSETQNRCDTIAMRKTFLRVRLFWSSWGHLGIPQLDQNRDRRIARKKREAAQTACWFTPTRK